jgi:hypothetical protein
LRKWYRFRARRFRKWYYFRARRFRKWYWCRVDWSILRKGHWFRDWSRLRRKRHCRYRSNYLPNGFSKISFIYRAIFIVEEHQSEPQCPSM